MNKNKNIFWALGIVTFPILLGIISVINGLNTRKQIYTQALTAYEKGDCESAKQKFDRVLNSSQYLNAIDRYNDKAIENKTICDYFTQVNNFAQTQIEQSRPDLALVEYLNFPKKYENDSLTTFVKNDIATLFLEYTSNGLISLDSCGELDYITQNKIISTEDSHLPYAYKYCGEVYLQNGELNKAQETNIKFLEIYQTDRHLSHDIMLAIVNNPTSCENISPLQENETISKLPNFLPTLYLVCGFKSQYTIDFSQAENYYNLVSINYADDSLFNELATNLRQNMKEEEQKLLLEVTKAVETIKQRIAVCIPANVVNLGGVSAADIYEVFNGQDCYTGQQIGPFKRIINVVPIIGELKTLKRLENLQTMLKFVETIINLEEVQSALDDVNQLDKAIQNRELLLTLLSDRDNQEALSINNSKMKPYIDRKNGSLDLGEYQQTILSLFNRNEPLIKPYIGMSVSSLNPKLAQNNNQAPGATTILPEIYGVFVHRIDSNTPAQKAGLLRSDIITHVNEQEIQSLEQLLESIANHSVGEIMQLTIIRNNVSKNIAVEVGNFYEMNID